MAGACGNIGRVSDRIISGRKSEAMHIWAEYEIVIERKEWCHSFERHGFQVTEKYLLERTLSKDGVNATRFISEKLHMECREVFLSVFSEEMKMAMAAGKKSFKRTVDLGKPVGEGILANSFQWTDSIPCVIGVYENRNGIWYEKTLYPVAVPKTIDL